MAGGTVESQSGLASALKIFIHLYNPHVKNHLLLKKKKKNPISYATRNVAVNVGVKKKHLF